MQVVRTVRLHTASERYVRVIGDGTPEGTKLLDYQGNPIPEVVTGITISMNAKGCARGLFTHVPVDLATCKPGEMQTFEAYVLFERLHPEKEAAELRRRIRSLEELPDRLVAVLRDACGDTLFAASPEPDYVDAEFTEEDEPEPESPLAVPGPPLRDLLTLRS